MSSWFQLLVNITQGLLNSGYIIPPEKKDLVKICLNESMKFLNNFVLECWFTEIVTSDSVVWLWLCLTRRRFKERPGRQSLLLYIVLHFELCGTDISIYQSL